VENEIGPRLRFGVGCAAELHIVAWRQPYLDGLQVLAQIGKKPPEVIRD